MSSSQGEVPSQGLRDLIMLIIVGLTHELQPVVWTAIRELLPSRYQSLGFSVGGVSHFMPFLYPQLLLLLL